MTSRTSRQEKTRIIREHMTRMVAMRLAEGLTSTHRLVSERIGLVPGGAVQYHVKSKETLLQTSDGHAGITIKKPVERCPHCTVTVADWMMNDKPCLSLGHVMANGNQHEGVAYAKTDDDGTATGETPAGNEDVELRHEVVDVEVRRDALGEGATCE